MTDLIALARDNKKTLAFYKPKNVKDLIYLPFEKNFKKLEQIKEKNSQLDLFSGLSDYKSVDPIEQPDYNFKFRFDDFDGTERTITFEDWEVHALYRNNLNTLHDKEKAAQKVVEKFMGIVNSDRFEWFFVVGTSYKNQKLNTSNPWLIIGLIYHFITDEEAQQNAMGDLFEGLNF